MAEPKDSEAWPTLSEDDVRAQMTDTASRFVSSVMATAVVDFLQAMHLDNHGIDNGVTKAQVRNFWEFRAGSRLAPSQRETSLQSNTVSHLLDSNLEAAQEFITYHNYDWFDLWSWQNIDNLTERFSEILTQRVTKVKSVAKAPFSITLNDQSVKASQFIVHSIFCSKACSWKQQIIPAPHSRPKRIPRSYRRVKNTPLFADLGRKNTLFSTKIADFEAQ